MGVGYNFIGFCVKRFINIFVHTFVILV